MLSSGALAIRFLFLPLPVSTHSPRGSCGTRVRLVGLVPGTLLGPEDAAASKALSRTARPKSPPDGGLSTLWFRPYLENCIVNASI
jgi:hypothetical protein